jgi:hypothetical protein
MQIIQVKQPKSPKLARHLSSVLLSLINLAVDAKNLAQDFWSVSYRQTKLTQQSVQSEP